MKKRIVLIFSFLIILCVVFYIVNAISIDKVTLVKFADPVSYVSYNGKSVGYSMVGHVLNGVNYPAYCIEPNKDGVFETSSYDVNITGMINDSKIVNIIRNGYPYKTPGELSLTNNQEAYYATKTALWCYVNSRDINDYASLSPEYDYILNAIKNIYNNGISSNGIISEPTISVDPINEIHVDEINDKYFSKQFKVSSNYKINSFDVSLDLNNLPEGTLITNIENNEKSSFDGNETFKVLIPIDNIIEDIGSVKVNVNAKIKTQKVLFGDAPDNLQDHAVTIMAEEDAYGSIEFEYEKIYGTIKILKTSSKENELANKEEGSFLFGAKFEIRNKDKNVVETIVTNEDGIALSQKLERGVYYIKEVESPEYYLEDINEYMVEIKNQNEEVEIKILDENAEIKVHINKTGPQEASSNEEITYSIFEAENMSNVALDKLRIVDFLPIEAVKIKKLNTGIWNDEVIYQIKYKTNYQSEEQILKNELNSLEEYEISLEEIELKEGEKITEIIFEFENVPIGFKEEKAISLKTSVLEGLNNNYEFINKVIIEGEYIGKKVKDEANCKTIIYNPIVEHPIELPKTGSF